MILMEIHTDLEEFYKIQASLRKEHNELQEIIKKAKGLYYENPEKYI